MIDHAAIVIAHVSINSIIITLYILHSEVQSVVGYEAFFPGEYRQMFPDGSIPNPPQLQPWVIPIHKLSHGTHLPQALEIQPKFNGDHPDEYVFKAQPRLGKENLTTYIWINSEHGFGSVSPSTALLPGKYSWWGVSVEDWYHSKCVKGQELRQVVLDLKSKRRFVAEYLQTNPPECPYGDHVFTVEFKKLLECYISSRQAVITPLNRIRFRFAGTLRYLNEICYVIIVSMVHDDEMLGKFDSTDERHNIRGLIDANGELIGSIVTPTFQVEHMIKCIPIRDYHSWETPAFAFYFPNDGNDYELRCPKGLVTKLQNVQHVCNYNCQRY